MNIILQCACEGIGDKHIENNKRYYALVMNITPQVLADGLKSIGYLKTNIERNKKYYAQVMSITLHRAWERIGKYGKPSTTLKIIEKGMNKNSCKALGRLEKGLEYMGQLSKSNDDRDDYGFQKLILN